LVPCLAGGIGCADASSQHTWRRRTRTANRVDSSGSWICSLRTDSSRAVNAGVALRGNAAVPMSERPTARSRAMRERDRHALHCRLAIGAARWSRYRGGTALSSCMKAAATACRAEAGTDAHCDREDAQLVIEQCAGAGRRTAAMRASSAVPGSGRRAALPGTGRSYGSATYCPRKARAQGVSSR
jgi:hypothetical protein